MALRNFHRPSGVRQRGVALVVGLILLLVLTMIGVIAIKSSTQQQRMAASYQQQTQTFQAAESNIRLIMGQINGRPGNSLNRNTDFLSTAVNNAPTTRLTPATATPPLAPAGVVTVAGNVNGFNSAANIYLTATPLNSGMPSGASLKAGAFTPFYFDVNSVATQANTGARSNNIQGVFFWGPGGQSP